MELREEDSGGHWAVQVGEEVSVVLTENPTTGYRWHSEIDASMLEQTGDRYEGPAEPRGATGTRRLTFKVLHVPARLHLVKRRGWEGTVAEEFMVGLDAVRG
jgi:predicted secreted protein